jgi:hypothetical protein
MLVPVEYFVGGVMHHRHFFNNWSVKITLGGSVPAVGVAVSCQVKVETNFIKRMFDAMQFILGVDKEVLEEIYGSVPKRDL